MERWMTDEQIRTSYRDAKNRPAQITILAQLNACTRKEILRVLAGMPGIKDDTIHLHAMIDEDAAYALYKQGGTDSEIATTLGCHLRTARNWRETSGLSSQRERINSNTTGDFNHESALDLYYQKMNDREISEALGCSVHVVLYWRRKCGLKCWSRRETIDYGEFAHEKALILYYEGLSDMKIACSLKCTREQIRDWRYKHKLISQIERRRQRKCM